MFWKLKLQKYSFITFFLIKNLITKFLYTAFLEVVGFQSYHCLSILELSMWQTCPYDLSWASSSFYSFNIYTIFFSVFLSTTICLQLFSFVSSGSFLFLKINIWIFESGGTNWLQSFVTKIQSLLSINLSIHINIVLNAKVKWISSVGGD